LSLADRILIGRKFAGMSQQQLAQALDVRRSTVANWESADNVIPGVDRLRQLASAFNFCFEWLVTGRGEMSMANHIHDVPAVKNLLVLEDPGEIRLVLAWRSAPARIRPVVLEIMKLRAPTKRQTVRKGART